MAETRTIEIDFEVNKQIELERTSFQETPNDVLRRLLKIGGKAAPAPEGAKRPWSGKGVTLRHGTEVRMEYNGKVYNGVIDDGSWLVEGKRFGSPSAAAGGVAVTKNGSHPSLDGWIYWRVRLPGEASFKSLDVLRMAADGTFT
jgi:hypothetical protein